MGGKGGATKPDGEGEKALVAGPIKKNNFFCGFPYRSLLEVRLDVARLNLVLVHICDHGPEYNILGRLYI